MRLSLIRLEGRASRSTRECAGGAPAPAVEPLRFPLVPRAPVGSALCCLPRGRQIAEGVSGAVARGFHSSFTQFHRGPQLQFHPVFCVAIQTHRLVTTKLTSSLIILSCRYHRVEALVRAPISPPLAPLFYENGINHTEAPRASDSQNSQCRQQAKHPVWGKSKSGPNQHRTMCSCLLTAGYYSTGSGSRIAPNPLGNKMPSQC